MKRRTILLILTPFIIVLVILTLIIGLLQTLGLFSLNIVSSLREIGSAPEIIRQAHWISTTLTVLNLPIRILFVPAIFLVALIFHRLNWRIAGWLLDSSITDAVRRPTAVLGTSHDPTEPIPAGRYRPQHRQTLQHLVASLISLIAFGTAVLLTMLQFINSAGIAVIATVASTALGFGARDYINDLIMGIGDVFEDNFNVGEKVEVLRTSGHLQGTVKKVNVRTALLQTPDGIPVVIPHGEMRVIRNYSRGDYSTTSVSFQVPSHKLEQTIVILDKVTAESMTLFPDLVEPLQLVSRSGDIGAHTELLLTGKARHGRGAALRLALLSTMEDRLENLPTISTDQDNEFEVLT
jgi:small-conductance mechanosensitive channel